MPRARLIVCERTGEWTVALRQADAELQRWIRETRSLNEALTVLVESPSSLVAVDLNRTSVEAAVEFLWKVSRTYPEARAIVLARQGQEQQVDVLREAGAVHAVIGKLDLAATARLIRKHLARYPSEPSLIEEIKQRLPWPDSAGSE